MAGGFPAVLVPEELVVKLEKILVAPGHLGKSDRSKCHRVVIHVGIHCLRMQHFDLARIVYLDNLVFCSIKYPYFTKLIGHRAICNVWPFQLDKARFLLQLLVQELGNILPPLSIGMYWRVV